MQDLTASRLRQCYTGVVHDVMRAMGLSNFVLPTDLRPLLLGEAIAGPAFTIRGRTVQGADAHQTLLEWTGLLSKCPPGHIWVSQPNDRSVAHMGELSAETLKNKGVLGCVTDGFVRDTGFIRKIGFQTWSCGYTPKDVVGVWLPEALNEDIRIGEVDISPGDYLVGDDDGLIRVPLSLLEDVILASETAMQAENMVRTAILKGVDPQEAYLTYGKF